MYPLKVESLSTYSPLPHCCNYRANKERLTFSIDSSLITPNSPRVLITYLRMVSLSFGMNFPRNTLMLWKTQLSMLLYCISLIMNEITLILGCDWYYYSYGVSSGWRWWKCACDLLFKLEYSQHWVSIFPCWEVFLRSSPCFQRFQHYILLQKTTMISNCNLMTYILTCHLLGRKESKFIIIL